MSGQVVARIVLLTVALLSVLACSEREREPARASAGGRFRPLQAPDAGGAAPEASVENRARLEALGYSGAGVSATELAGVTRHEGKRVQPGWNLYTSGHAPCAILTDLEGRVHHRWTRSFEDVWPERVEEASSESASHWRKARLLPGGDLLAIFDGLGIMRIDRDSNVLWANPLPAHHDLEILPNGVLYVLTREARVVPEVGGEHPILDEHVTILGPDGVERRRVSILDALLSSPWASLLAPERVVHPEGDGLRFRGDLLHTNALRLVPTNWGRSLGVRGGEALLSIRHLDALVVLDLEEGSVPWLLRGEFRRQHDPRPLPSGNVLLFANNPKSGRSRILELSPSSGEVAWSYAGSARRPLFSRLCGAAQRLTNGNTLITETDNGRALEVTPSGEIVWEFWNPHRAAEDHGLIASIFEAERMPLDRVDWPLAVEPE